MLIFLSILKEERQAAMVPMYIKSADEHKRPFLDPNSAVCKAGLELLMYEEVSTTNMHKFKELYEGKITKGNSKGRLVQLPFAVLRSFSQFSIFMSCTVANL